jgi:DNA polymerase III subunit gamma/tau
MPVLARAWQMLLKGLEEVRLAQSPLLATEMVLVRLAYAADLPPPSELVRGLADGSAAASPGRPAPPPLPDGAPASVMAAPQAPVAPASFAEAVALFERFGEPMLHGWLYQAARLVHFEPGRIELRLAAGTPPDLAGRVAAALGRWTGERWLVSLAGEGQEAAPTLADQAEATRRQHLETLAEDPRIKPVLEHFPGAAIVDVRSAASR